MAPQYMFVFDTHSPWHLPLLKLLSSLWQASPRQAGVAGCPWRLENEGALYHVFSRGNNHQRIFMAIAWGRPLKSPFTLQLLTLGCLFVLMAIVTDSLYALIAGTVGQWFKSTCSFMLLERYLIGNLCIGLGIMDALADNKRH
jgi:hypothetical protein